MSLVNVKPSVILDIYDHNLTPSSIKTIALDSKTRFVAAVIRNRGEIYDIGQDAAVALTVVRPDKTRVQITGETYSLTEVTRDDETITYYGASAELTQLALAIKGNLRAQFKITSGEQELRTEIFTINNGEALDAGDGDWAGDLDGHNLDEMAQSIEDLSSDVSEIQGDVSELKSGFTKLTTATAEDVGKALKAKTVADGKVTEWEFGEAGGSVETDKTLSESNVPADAKVTGDRISAIENGGTIETPISQYTTFQNGRLANGVFYPDRKYRVACAEIIHFEKETLLRVDPEYRIWVSIFNGETFVAADGAVLGAYVVPEGVPIKIEIAKVTEDTSSVADVDEFTSKVTAQLKKANAEEELYAINNFTTRPISDMSFFGNGGYANAGMYYDRKYRVFMGRNIVYCEKPTVLYIANGYRIEVQTMVDGAYTSSSGWVQSSFSIPANTYVRICIAKVTEDTSSVADVDEFASKITFYPNVVNTLKKVDKFDGAISDIKNLQNDTVASLGEFVRGVLSNGSISTSQADRVTTKDIIHFDYDVEFYVAEGFCVFLSYYTSDGTYTRDVTWQTVVFKVPTNSYVRMTISRVTRISGETANIDEFVSQVRYETPLMASVSTVKNNDVELTKLSDLSAPTIGAYGSFANGRIVDGTAYIERSSNYKNRASSEEFIRFEFEATLYIATGFRIVIFYFINGEPSHSVDWTQGTYTIPAGSEVMLMIARTSEDSSETADIEEFTSTIHVYSKLLSKVTASANYHSDGETLDVKRHGYDVHKLFACPNKRTQGWPQGMAIYNGIIAQFCSVPDDSMHLINLSDGTVIATLTDTHSGHGNTAVFSDEFYDANDEFPLCYVSTGESMCNVVRVSRAGVTLVRTIDPDDIEHSGYQVSYTIDKDTNTLWGIGYYVNNWQQPSGNHMIFSHWDLDDMTETSAGVFKPRYIDGFTMPYINGAVQGIRYFNNRLWICQQDIRQDPQVYTNIFVMDTVRKRYVSIMAEFPLDIKNYESEAIEFVLADSGDKYDMMLLTTENYYRITFS